MSKDTHIHDDGACCECGDNEHCCCDCPVFRNIESSDKES